MTNETTKLAEKITRLIIASKKNNFILGIVKQVNPLVVIIHELEFTEDEFYKNDIFLNKDVNLNLMEGNYHHDYTGVMTYANYFKKNDKLLFLEFEGELILLCKVV